MLCLQIDNEDEHVVSGDAKGVIRVFNLWTGKMINRLPGKALPIQSLRFSRAQKYQLLSASCDGTIRLSHILTTKTLFEIKEENDN